MFSSRDFPIVVALGSADREHFMWPYIERDHKVTLNIEGQEVTQIVKIDNDCSVSLSHLQMTVRSLANSPRVFEISDLLTPEECDHFFEQALSLRESMTPSHVRCHCRHLPFLLV